MKVVIDIPEDDYKLACNYPNALIACYAHYIKEGIVLPNNHGRIIEVTDELLTALSNFIAETGIDEVPYMSASDWIEMNAPTVIEEEERTE